jgi:hypothetical protein
MEWLNWSNFAYFMVLMLTLVGTIVGTKYRLLVKELKDIAQAYKEAMKDGKLSEKEKEKLAKESMDVVMAAVRLVWKF